MNAKVAERRTSPDLRLWVGLAGAAFGWWLLYRVNGPFWDWVVYRAAGLSRDGRLGETVHFFVFDTTKILLLLSGIIFVVTVLRSFMSLERTRALLGGRREGFANALAAGLGVATPFCSCSAVPAFMGFVAAGVPIGVTLSFLMPRSAWAAPAWFTPSPTIATCLPSRCSSATFAALSCPPCQVKGG